MASGVAAASVELTPAVVAGIVAAVSVACVLWWAYLGFVAGASERALRRAPGATRGNVARDVFTFGHLPLVVGVTSYALVAKHVVPVPLEPLHGPDLAVLAGAVAVFVGGMMALHWRIAPTAERSSGRHAADSGDVAPTLSCQPLVRPGDRLGDARPRADQGGGSRSRPERTPVPGLSAAAWWSWTTAGSTPTWRCCGRS